MSDEKDTHNRPTVKGYIMYRDKRKSIELFRRIATLNIDFNLLVF